MQPAKTSSEIHLAPSYYLAKKQCRIKFKQKMLRMLMQNSWKITIQIQNEEMNDILHADGYNFMYHKLILLSMKRVKQRK